MNLNPCHCFFHNINWLFSYVRTFQTRQDDMENQNNFTKLINTKKNTIFYNNNNNHKVQQQENARRQDECVMVQWRRVACDSDVNWIKTVPQFKNSSTILLPRDVPSKSTNPTNTHAERQSTNRNGFDDDEDGCDDVRLCQSVRDYIILILYCEWVRVCVCWLCVFGFIYENVFVNPHCRTQDGRSGSNFASHSVQEF